MRSSTFEIGLSSLLKSCDEPTKTGGAGGLNHFCQLSIYGIWVQISIASVAPLVARCIQNGHFTREKPRKIAAWNYGKAA